MWTSTWRPPNPPNQGGQAPSICQAATPSDPQFVSTYRAKVRRRRSQRPLPPSLRTAAAGEYRAEISPFSVIRAITLQWLRPCSALLQTSRLGRAPPRQAAALSPAPSPGPPRRGAR
jgi:hypothetical protein